MSTQQLERFAPLDRPAQWTQGLLLAGLVLSVVGIVSSFMQIDLLSRASSWGISEAETAANDARQQLILVLKTVVFIGTVVAFLVWFHRAHRNLPVLGGRELKYTPGWAVGGFFVPFLNFVRPLQVMREVWHASDPMGLERDAAPSGPSLRNQLGTPSLITWWWLLFLILCFFDRIISRMELSKNETIDYLQVLTTLNILSDVLNVPASLVAFCLVGRITTWQNQRAARIAQTGTVAAQKSGSHVNRELQ